MEQLVLESAYFGAALSLLAYWIGARLKARLKSAVFNPILIAVALIIGVLLLLDIEYDTYYASAKYVSYLLTPTTVCLAIPLYEQLQLLRKNMTAVLVGIAAGTLASVGCILLMGVLFAMTTPEIATLLPKSVTTAIGVPIAEQLGGYGSITAIVIVLTGVVGNVIAEGFLRLLKITEPIARGIAIGTSSHSVGTAKANELGEVEGAMSGLAIAVAGLMTVLVIAFLPF